MPLRVDQLDHSHALRLVGVVLAGEGVLVHLHSQSHEDVVDRIDIRGVCVDAARGVGHVLSGVPRVSLGGPVARVDQQTVANVRQHYANIGEKMKFNTP